jgi:chemosensory pili system protein ChpA (sensor histidine kinase/response regulator)
MDAQPPFLDRPDRADPTDRPADSFAADDLSALAWVHGELRRSLDAAHKALRRHLKEADAIGRSDVDSVDPAVLRSARVHLHQGVGALELVGLPQPAQVLRASEAAVQRWVSKPALVNAAAVETLEKSSFALLDYLGRLLAGKPLSAIALFPQYRAAQLLAGADRIHPADLWADDWQWHPLPADASAQPRVADDNARTEMEFLALALMRQPDAVMAGRMSDLCAGLAAGATRSAVADNPPRLATLWQLAAAFFEAQAARLLASDVYSKRIASRLLAQLRMSVNGQDQVSERLAQDLLFFCANASRPTPAGSAPRLAAVRAAWHIDSDAGIGDYETPRLGRFDPAWIAQAKKRIAGAKDSWSAVAGGELHRLSSLNEQFSLVGDSVQRLFPCGEALAAALSAAAQQTVDGGDSPPPALAMEVATGILCVDASIEDGELDHPELGTRVQRLAQRIDAVRSGQPAKTLEPWMEELYRRVSDRQTMGSVVQELRASLSDAEKQIDQYFRDPTRRDLLIPVPGQLSSMRGVLSVLGLEQASAAVLHMRDDVDALVETEVDPERAVAAGTFDRLADNLGALSFLIDMLSVQPQLAKSLFRYDPETGNLSAVMGQSQRVSAFAAFDETSAPPPSEASAPLRDQALSLVDAAAQDEVSDTEFGRRLEQLSQQAAAADEATLARMMGGAKTALRQADDDDTRQAVRDDLAEAMAKFAPMPSLPEPVKPSAPIPPPRPAPASGSGLEDDPEMREIFIEEAREVVDSGRRSLAMLSDQPEDVAEMTALRRAFHTLKGSSRMVGLGDYGDAAWACEQLFNSRIAKEARLDPALQAFTGEALSYLGGWAEAIADGSDLGHRSEDIVTSADALRLHDTRIPVPAPGAAPQATEEAPISEVHAEASPDVARGVDGAMAPVDDITEAALPELSLATDFDAEGAEAAPLPEVLDAPLPTLLLPDAEADLNDGDTATAEPGLHETAATEPVVVEEPAEPLAAVDEPATAPATEDEPATAASAGGEPPESVDTAPAPAHDADTQALLARIPDLPSAEDLDFTSPPASLAEALPVADTVSAQPLPADWSDTMTLPTLDAADLGAAMPELPEVSFELDLGAFGDAPAEAPTVVAAAAVDELPPFDLDAPPDDAALARDDLLSPVPAPDVDVIELDFDQPPADEADAPAPAAETVDEVDTDTAGDVKTADAETIEAEATFDDDEQVKVIGPLRIGIPLFNIYLNEADELSRRLGTELAEWSVEHHHRSVPDSAIALAHSLAGSSATVGYAELSTLARALEHALMRSRAGGSGRPGEAALFNDVADEIRRLLHQFAAGFLPAASSELADRLAEHERRPVEHADQAGSLGDAAGEDVSPDDADLPLDIELAATDASTYDHTHHAIDLPLEPAEPLPEAWLPEPEQALEETTSHEAPERTPTLGEPALAALTTAVPMAAASFAPLAEAPADGARAPVARADAFDDDDDIDATDAIDADLFPIFEEEAVELLPQLQARLRDWTATPDDLDAASACMRTLHTFKGGARLAGAMRLGEMAHRLETAIEHRVARTPLEAADIEPLLGRVDTMSAAFEALCKPASAAAEAKPAAPPAAAQVATAAAAERIERSVAAAAPAPTAATTPSAHAVEPASRDAAAIDWTRFADGPAAALPMADKPAAGAAAVRVRSALLDRLVNQAGEVSITRARIDADVRQMQTSLNELTDSLDRMRRQLRDIELQADTQISSRLEAAKASSLAFDPLEMDRYTRFQELTRFLAESVNDVATLQRSLQRTLQSTEDELASQARLTRDLQDDLLRTRMVEFESAADRLYRTVRQAGKDAAKPVRLDIVGGAIEVDRGVLERLVGPFEHLLRNSVAHGIETPDQRVAAGKDRSGTITINVTHEGNEVGVDVRDDGAGLDLARIRERAVARGLIADDAELTDAELANLIFRPGFSTAEAVTELAGRGVGLDVVLAEVNAMGGRIETASTPGQGSSFRLLVPLTTAVTQVVMLRCGDVKVAVPSTLVEIVKRVPVAEVEAAYASGGLQVGEQMVPFYWLAALLQSGSRGATGGRTQPVVVVRSAAQRVALHVDEVLGNQEVVVKNLGPQLSRLPGLAGVTLLPSGAVTLIYNPVALATLYGDVARQRMRATATALTAPEPVLAAPLAPLVLVVDDSLTVRKVTQRLLLREGYRVTLAKDGMDALERLAEERPAVMLSDIEMPRMDGFDLLRNVRADQRLASLPVIMITSRIAQKHRDHAAALGADHYLGKPFSEEELLSLVARHAGADIAA